MTVVCIFEWHRTKVNHDRTGCTTQLLLVGSCALLSATKLRSRFILVSTCTCLSSMFDSVVVFGMEARVLVLVQLYMVMLCWIHVVLLGSVGGS